MPPNRPMTHIYLIFQSADLARNAQPLTHMYMCTYVSLWHREAGRCWGRPHGSWLCDLANANAQATIQGWIKLAARRAGLWALSNDYGWWFIRHPIYTDTPHIRTCSYVPNLHYVWVSTFDLLPNSGPDDGWHASLSHSCTMGRNLRL